MMTIVGVLIVLASVIGGFLEAGGNLGVLVEPAEIIIIAGASIGALVIASPGHILKLVVKDFKNIFSSQSTTKASYTEVLLLLNQLFWKIRKDGLLAIEEDVENPAESEVFKRYKSIMSNKHTMEFICDNCALSNEQYSA